MKYNDVVKSKGIFQLINEKKVLNFDVEELETVFRLKYGDLEFTRNVELMFLTSETNEVAMNVLAKWVLLEYKEVWNKLYNTLQSKDLGLAKKAIRFISEHKSDNVTHSISAYDSDDLISDNADSHEHKSEHNKNYQEYDYTKLNNELQNYLLSDRIMLDVRNILFLKVI